jgi:hypothetical protein
MGRTTALPTLAAQAGAVFIVLGSYAGAVWRPRRRGRRAARMASAAPTRRADVVAAADALAGR